MPAKNIRRRRRAQGRRLTFEEQLRQQLDPNRRQKPTQRSAGWMLPGDIRYVERIANGKVVLRTVGTPFFPGLDRPKRRRGRPLKWTQVFKAMRRDVETGHRTVDELNAEKHDALGKMYAGEISGGGVSINIVREGGVPVDSGPRSEPSLASKSAGPFTVAATFSFRS